MTAVFVGGGGGGGGVVGGGGGGGGGTIVCYDNCLWLCASHLNSLVCVQVDDDLTCKLDLSTYRFSFMSSSTFTYPQWYAPEGQQLHCALLVHVCMYVSTLAWI